MQRSLPCWSASEAWPPERRASTPGTPSTSFQSTLLRQKGADQVKALLIYVDRHYSAV